MLSTYSKDLAASWKPFLQDPKHQKQATALNAVLQQLNAQIDALREACAQC